MEAKTINSKQPQFARTLMNEFCRLFRVEVIFQFHAAYERMGRMVGQWIEASTQIWFMRN
jgi:hypothetical protein